MTTITCEYGIDKVTIQATEQTNYTSTESDIICAKVSTAMLLARIFYYYYFRHVNLKVDNETKTMAITIKSKSPRAKDAIQILEGFFRDLEYDYPKYVKVEVK